MEERIAKLVGEAVIAAGLDIKSGTSELTDEEAMRIFEAVAHKPISREEVKDMVNVSDNKLYELIDRKQIPAGRKRAKFKERYWYKDEIILAINKLRNNKDR